MANLKKKTSDAVFEDAPSESYDMLAGYTDEDGVIHKTFTLREMDGEDEDSVDGSNNKNNPAKMVSLLLERCVTSIGTITPKAVGWEKWRQIIQSLFAGDQDYMFVKLKELSMGTTFEFSYECPRESCRKTITTEMTTSEIPIIPYTGKSVFPFELPRGYVDKKGVEHRKGTLRLATGLDRELFTPVYMKNKARGTTLMLVRLCKFDDGYVITEDVMSKFKTKDRDYLQKLLVSNSFGLDTVYEATCPSCGKEFKTGISLQNFT